MSSQPISSRPSSPLRLSPRWRGGFSGLSPNSAYAFINAIAVLIIACPCALGLATPISMTVAMGQGARVGILFRNAEAIERMRDIDTVVVDKTGTLTLGRPAMTDFSCKAYARTKRWHWSQAWSSFPSTRSATLSSRARKRAASTPAAGEDFDALNGLGVQAEIDGRRVLVGSRNFLAQHGVDTRHWEEQAEAWRAEAKTVVFFAVDGMAAGIAAVADPIKESTPEAIAATRRLGVRIVMLTGDSRRTADAVARQLGIDEALAEVLPEDKAGHVKRLQAEGRKVAMAGDGINDAPALAQADVGIAMGTGTDVAMESAGMTLVKGDLRGIERAIVLSRATMRNIRQNLAFRVRLQRARHPARRRCALSGFRAASVADVCRRRHGDELGIRRHQRAAAQSHQVITWKRGRGQEPVPHLSPPCPPVPLSPCPSVPLSA